MMGLDTAWRKEKREPRAPPRRTTSKREEIGRWKEALKALRVLKIDSRTTLLGWAL